MDNDFMCVCSSITFRVGNMRFDYVILEIFKNEFIYRNWYGVKHARLEGGFGSWEQLHKGYMLSERRKT